MIKEMNLHLRNGFVTLRGGPYKRKPPNTIGVKMAAEINEACHISIATEDFGVPNETDLIVGLMQCAQYIRYGDDIYVGCMGGTGRTGLFLAALVKATMSRPKFRVFGGLFWSKPDGLEAVLYVRNHYKSGAVETLEQEHYIRDLDTKEVSKQMYKLGLL